MPFSPAKLPPAAKNLAGSAMTRFVAAANAALKSNPKDEGAAIAIGLAAAKKTDEGSEHEEEDGVHTERSDARWVAGASSSLPVKEGDWDAGLAKTRVFRWATDSEGNLDPTKASRAFLVFDRDATGLRGSYKLPVADIVGGKLVAIGNGIRNALSRLPQTDAPRAVRNSAKKVAQGLLEKLREEKTDSEVHRLAVGDSVHAIRYDFIGTVCVVDLAGNLPSDAPPDALKGFVDETTGFLHVRDSKIARSGTLVYSDGRQEWREFRSDATIAQAAESFSGVVFTHNHPPVLVTKDNVSQFQAGHVTNARKDGRFLVADEIVITRPSAIDRAQQAGGWELSIGFLTDVVRRDGTHDGKDFAFEQTLLEGNHVAGVDEGRAGPEIRLAMDSAFSIAAFIEPDATTPPPTANAEENTMLDEEKKDGAPKETPEAKPEPPKAVVTDAAPEKKDEAEPAKPEPRVDHNKLVRERVSLIRAADLVLDTVDDSADDKTIRLAVIAKVEGTDSIAGHEGWDDGFLKGRFEGALQGFKRRSTVDTAAQIAIMTGGRVPRKDDGEKLSLNDIHAQYQADMRGAYLKPAAHTEPKHG